MKLSYDSTVSRHLVHRAAAAEVLLTDWRQTGPDTFTLAAQWPRGHLFYCSRDGRFDPMLMAETIRQTGILLAHVGYDVPPSRAFLMQRLRFGCVPSRMYSAHAPLDLVVTATVSEILRRACGVGGMRVDLTLLRDDEPIGTGNGVLRCVAPAAYERLRWSGAVRETGPPVPVSPVDPTAVGRQLPCDVVIGPPDGDGTCPLRIPLAHPVFFDHPLDHVPGMLAIEAIRQAAVAAVGRPAAPVLAAEATFPTFLELDRECVVVVEGVQATGDRDVVTLRCEQDGAVAVRGTVALGH